MYSAERLAMEEDWNAHYDYMQEVYGAEARAIARSEEAWEYCNQVDAIFERCGFPQPEYVDDDALRLVMAGLHPNHPLYVELEVFLNV